MICSFQCIGPSYPLLHLFLGILFFWLQLQKEFFFLIFSEVLLVFKKTVDFYTLILCPETFLYF